MVAIAQLQMKAVKFYQIPSLLLVWMRRYRAWLLSLSVKCYLSLCKLCSENLLPFKIIISDLLIVALFSFMKLAVIVPVYFPGQVKKKPYRSLFNSTVRTGSLLSCSFKNADSFKRGTTTHRPADPVPAHSAINMDEQPSVACFTKCIRRRSGNCTHTPLSQHVNKTRGVSVLLWW